jgi:hypothetical protein
MQTEDRASAAVGVLLNHVSGFLPPTAVEPAKISFDNFLRTPLVSAYNLFFHLLPKTKAGTNKKL